MAREHVYDGERCVYCNVNTYDDALYGPFECVVAGVERELIRYTTETPSKEQDDGEYQETDR